MWWLFQISVLPGWLWSCESLSIEPSVRLWSWESDSPHFPRMFCCPVPCRWQWQTSPINHGTLPCCGRWQMSPINHGTGKPRDLLPKQLGNWTAFLPGRSSSKRRRKRHEWTHIFRCQGRSLHWGQQPPRGGLSWTQGGTEAVMGFRGWLITSFPYSEPRERQDPEVKQMKLSALLLIKPAWPPRSPKIESYVLFGETL